MELNELLLDKNQEPQWRETARWIKFEEDVEEETERWGKPHVASLSFRSLLELRRTLAHGNLPCPTPPSVLTPGNTRHLSPFSEDQMAPTLVLGNMVSNAARAPGDPPLTTSAACCTSGAPPSSWGGCRAGSILRPLTQQLLYGLFSGNGGWQGLARFRPL